MNNPYFPNRKIPHADLLTKAGFKINRNWYKNQPAYSEPRGNCDKLIYWNKGEINVIFFDYQKVSLENLIGRVEAQVKYILKKKAVVTFQGENE